jgi:hypothetical protein
MSSPLTIRPDMSQISYEIYIKEIDSVSDESEKFIFKARQSSLKRIVELLNKEYERIATFIEEK